jgi:hypothetical protein
MGRRALADQIQAGDALAAGHLVRPFDVVATRYAYYLVRRPGARVTEAASAFEAWLEVELNMFTAKLAKTAALTLENSRTTGSSKPLKRWGRVAARQGAAGFGTNRVRKPPIT